MPQQLTVIITGSHASMWYNNSIGSQYDVTEVSDQQYYQYEGHKIIFKSDCKILK